MKLVELLKTVTDEFTRISVEVKKFGVCFVAEHSAEYFLEKADEELLQATISYMGVREGNLYVKVLQGKDV